MSRRNPKTPAGGGTKPSAAAAAQQGEKVYTMVVASPSGPRRVSATSNEVAQAAKDAYAPRVRTANTKGHATVGSMTAVKDGKIVDDIAMLNRIRLAKALNGQGVNRFATMFDGYGMGGQGADIGDSANLSAYNFEFPVDSLEQPQSRRQELRYYRLACDRDPIVGRGIDMHVELTLAKLILEKPKCSVQSFADYVFDWFNGWAQDVDLFDSLLHSAREYWASGEAFPFCEHKGDISKFPLCPVALTHGSRGQSRTPISNSHNPSIGSDESALYAWKRSSKRGAADAAWERHQDEDEFGLFDDEGKPKVDLKQELRKTRKEYKLLNGEYHVQAKMAALGRKIAAVRKTAEPGDEAPAPLMEGPLSRLKTQRDEAMNPTPDAGAEGDIPDAGGANDIGLDDTALSGEAPDMGSGGGGLGAMGGGLGGDMGMDGGMGGDMGAPAEDPHTRELKRYLSLLERKKELLEELLALQDAKQHEAELFGHLVNPEYMGPDRVVLLPPDVVEIKRDPRFNSAPTIYYRPSEAQKTVYLEDPKILAEDKQTLETEGIIPLNDDPSEGSYVLHFARRKAPFEDHGRSVLQRCMRTIIYREKLRQVQTTLASRNMTPKTLIVAPEVSVAELDALRVHVDEAKADPDYTIVVNYDVTWNEIGSEGRILSLESEWNHTNAEIAIGLGFTPELLTGEGFYGGDRIRVEMLNTTYIHFRDLLSEMVENKIFKPIAMRKGFYEIDDFGNPRWIYPKLNFSRLALRDSGDVYDMLYNLYIKNSVPIDVIYEFLNLDPETCRRKLEEDLFTVKDAKMNQVLDALYGAVSEKLLATTDVVDRIAKGLTLKTKNLDEQEGAEGSGEGM